MNSYRILTILIIFSSPVFWGCSPPSPPKKEPTAEMLVSPSPSPIISASDIKAANRYRQLGLQYRQQGDLVKSIEALKKSVQLNPNHLDGRVILGWTQHLAKQPLAAQTTLEETIKIAPDHVAAYNALGIAQVKLGWASDTISVYGSAGGVLAHSNTTITGGLWQLGYHIPIIEDDTNITKNGTTLSRVGYFSFIFYALHLVRQSS